jgi:acetate kinase
MNVLTLIPRRFRLNYAFFTAERRTALIAGRLEHRREAADEQSLMEKELRRLHKLCLEFVPYAPEIVAIRSPFGGGEFDAATPLTPAVLHRLRALIPQAPLHLPGIADLAETCLRLFADKPVVLVFETAFFTDLPACENGYGLQPEAQMKVKIRRFGFHGIFHQAAFEAAKKKMERNGDPPQRVLSVCLEPRPEVAAILDRRPLLITGGTTPLEGLPGETTCGDLDPGIILYLAERMKWGPEQINALLTQESGLSGMAQRPLTLSEVFDPHSPELKPLQDFFFHRLLLACGAGLAALGGIDALVFSGRREWVGEILGPRLVQHFKRLPGKPRISWLILRESLERLVADEALKSGVAAGSPS